MDLAPIMDALNFDPWTFLFQIINLFIVFGCLYLIIYKPVLKMVAEREEHIETSLKNADEAEAKAKALAAEYEEKITNARSEAQTIIERANKLAAEIEEEARQRAQQEAGSLLEKARREIEREKIEALREIRGEIADLVYLTATRVIPKTLTPEDQKLIVDEALREVEKV